jgi:type IV pilus assembly protein PilA
MLVQRLSRKKIPLNHIRKEEQKMRRQHGFTLVELMVVIAIIGILAAIAIPNFISYRTRAYASEALVIGDSVRKDIIDYYDHTGVFPADNAAAGLPEPEAIRGKYVKSLTVKKGEIHIAFDDSARREFKDKFLLLKPEANTDNPSGPIRWSREDNF